MPRFAILIVLLISINAHAIFWAPGGRCPSLLTSAHPETAQIRAIEPIFFPTLMQIGNDHSLSRWVLAGGSQNLNFKFIHAALKKVTEHEGLSGSVERRQLEYYLDDTMNYASTTRSSYLARMNTMKLIGEGLDGKIVVDPTLIYRVGILSGQIKDRGPTDQWLTSKMAEERRMKRTNTEGSPEIYWLRLNIYIYRRILKEIPVADRTRFSRNELLRKVSKNNPFGLAVLKIQIARLVRAGALTEKPLKNSRWERGLGFDSLLSVAANHENH